MQRESNFHGYLTTTAQQISTLMEQLLTRWSADLDVRDLNLDHLVRHFRESCRGGKKIRGTLVKLGYELTREPYTPEILKPAVAYELFQVAIITHDDIIDRSPLRRGQPTLHQRLGNGHYGTSQAITLGDIGFFLAVRILMDSNFSPTRKSRAIESFAFSASRTCLGQLLDVYLTTQGGRSDEQAILTMMQMKTAQYTVAGPLQLGAILAGADAAYLKELMDFGVLLGIAFQIQDDILGVFGDEIKLGKSILSDIREGKQTLLYSHALAKSNMRQRTLLANKYGQADANEEDAHQIRHIFVETGALGQAQELASAYVAKAKTLVANLATTEMHYRLLVGLADFLIAREG